MYVLFSPSVLAAENTSTFRFEVSGVNRLRGCSTTGMRINYHAGAFLDLGLGAPTGGADWGSEDGEC